MQPFSIPMIPLALAYMLARSDIACDEIPPTFLFSTPSRYQILLRFISDPHNLRSFIWEEEYHLLSLCLKLSKAAPPVLVGYGPSKWSMSLPSQVSLSSFSFPEKKFRALIPNKVFFICLRETLETGIIVSVLLSFLKQTLGPESNSQTYKRLVRQVR